MVEPPVEASVVLPPLEPVEASVVESPGSPVVVESPGVPEDEVSSPTVVSGSTVVVVSSAVVIVVGGIVVTTGPVDEDEDSESVPVPVVSSLGHAVSRSEPHSVAAMVEMLSLDIVGLIRRGRAGLRPGKAPLIPGHPGDEKLPGSQIP